MNIIIVGCGKVGATLAEQLSKEGHDIVVVDKKSAPVISITETLDIMGIVGSGTSYRILMKRVEKADLLIAVTGSDELNLLCCLIARKPASAIQLLGSVIPSIMTRLILLGRKWLYQ